MAFRLRTTNSVTYSLVRYPSNLAIIKDFYMSLIRLGVS